MGEIETKTEQIKKAGLEDITLRPGPRVRHGGYTYIRTGKVPKKKAEVERYLTWVRQTYIEDVAGEERNLTAGQTVLLNKIILLEGLCRCIEITVIEVAEKSGQLPVMPQKYMSYVNSIVKICGMLGIERREPVDNVPTPLEIAERIDREEAEAAVVDGKTPESDSKVRTQAGRKGDKEKP